MTLRRAMVLMAITCLVLAIVARPLRVAWVLWQQAGRWPQQEAQASLFMHGLCSPFYPVLWLIGAERAWPWADSLLVHDGGMPEVIDSGVAIIGFGSGAMLALVGGVFLWVLSCEVVAWLLKKTS